MYFFSLVIHPRMSAMSYPCMGVLGKNILFLGAPSLNNKWLIVVNGNIRGLSLFLYVAKANSLTDSTRSKKNNSQWSRI